MSLNPYCSGQRSRTGAPELSKDQFDSLNPYCSGQRSRTQVGRHVQRGQRVLILIVVDKGLVHQIATINDVSLNVLILIVVDKGLVLDLVPVSVTDDFGSLNPYCSGQRSRTQFKQLQL